MGSYKGNRGSCGDIGGAGGSGDCVKDTVRKILDAQREVSEGGSYDCGTSCDRSLDDLLSPSMEKRGRFTTIPFMLTCRNTCKTWIGAGFCGHGGDSGRHGHFECIESPIFKVKGFVGRDSDCVRLELLLPEHHGGDGDHGGEDYHGGCAGEVCNMIGYRYFKNLVGTGVCITVNLNCFCGISCLPATTPL